MEGGSSSCKTMSNDLYHDINTAQVMPSEDWTYTMRRTMQEIVPGVFLGIFEAISPFLMVISFTLIRTIRFSWEEKV